MMQSYIKHSIKRNEEDNSIDINISINVNHLEEIDTSHFEFLLMHANKIRNAWEKEIREFAYKDEMEQFKKDLQTGKYGYWSLKKAPELEIDTRGYVELVAKE